MNFNTVSAVLLADAAASTLLLQAAAVSAAVGSDQCRHPRAGGFR
jgi:hypothetical protein